MAGTVVIMAVFTAFFRSTRAGKMMQATADNARAATLVGIRIDRIYTLSFGTGAAIAAAAAVLTAPLTLLYPDIGFAFFLKGFAAAVLGGLTSLPGAVLGGLLVGVAEFDGRRLHPFQRDGGVAVRRHHARSGAEAERPARVSARRGGSSVAPFSRRNVLLALLVAAIVLPPFANFYHLFVANLVVIYVLLAIGLNILVGYAGQLAFANAAMFGIGAYATGLLQVQLGWSFWLAFPAGATARGGGRLGHLAAGAAPQRPLPGAVDAGLRASHAMGVPALGERHLRRWRLQDPAACRSRRCRSTSRLASTT